MGQRTWQQLVRPSRSGLEASQRPPELWDSLRADMDEAAAIIYDKTQLDVRQPLSGWLMPVAPMVTEAASAATAPAQGAQTV